LPEERENTINDNRRNAEEIVRRLKQSGYEAYFVGGCVRDFILGDIPGDYDIVTSALPDQVMTLFSHTVAIGAKFGVVAVIVEHHPYEVATFRSDDITKTAGILLRFIFLQPKKMYSGAISRSTEF